MIKDFHQTSSLNSFQIRFQVLFAKSLQQLVTLGQILRFVFQFTRWLEILLIWSGINNIKAEDVVVIFMYAAKAAAANLFFICN